MLITPEYVFQDVTHITPEFLAQKGICALVLDVDNTIADDRSLTVPPEITQWLDTMRAAGISLTILSNGAKPRVKPFAESLGLQWVSRSAKPLPIGMAIARKRVGVRRNEMAMVGDQLFTDRLVAALYGVPALVVIPRGGDLNKYVRFKRKLEKRFWMKYYRKGGKTL